MAQYQLIESGVLDKFTRTHIPATTSNVEWNEYLAWVAEGNVPDPDPYDYLAAAKVNRTAAIWVETSARTDVNKGRGRSEEARHMARLSRQARGQVLNPADEARSAAFEAALDYAETVYAAAEVAAEAVEEAADIAAVEAVVVSWPPVV